MTRKLFFALTLLLLLPALVLAQAGKLRGIVTDKSSGEPLIGANVVIEGTTLGASTDVNGEYIILNVPPGVYSIRVSYIGYAPMTISNVRVNSNLTTTQDFQVSSIAIQVGEVEVVAVRPLIQRNTTNTVRMTTQETIKNLPFRGLQNIVALEAGVVQKDGQLHVRGGRAGEVGFYVDGANVTNPVFNSENVSIIQEALEELQLQAGGYTAEHGGAMSGIIRSALRTGPPQYNLSIDYQTDDFAKPGSQFLSTSAYGYRNGVLTVGGPVPMVKNLRFFLAGQHNYLRTGQVLWLEPFKFTGLVTDINDARGPGVLLPDSGTIEFKRNYLYNNPREQNTAQGTLMLDLATVKVRLSGSYDLLQTQTGGAWPGALQTYYNLGRNRHNRTGTAFGNLRVTHVLSPTTFYEVGFSAQERSFKTYDPIFEDDWMKYPDSIANAEKGYTGFRARFRGPEPYSIINNFLLNHPNTPNNTYQVNSQSSMGVFADLTSQVTRHWELKVGGRYERWTARLFAVGNISNYMRFRFGEDGKSPYVFTDLNGNGSTEDERRILLAKRGGINHYGYDVDGNIVDSGFDAPPHPTFASAYVQNKFEYSDLILNVGARYEYFDKDRGTFKHVADYLDYHFDPNLDVIDEATLEKEDPFALLLPRINFSFPVTDNTVFYAQYGKFAQMPSLNRLYVGNTTLSRTVSPITRGNAYLTYVGLFMKPERTTQYEMGIRQILSNNFALTLSGFYKDLKDQLATRILSAEGSRLFIAFLNEDFGTVKGLELTLELRRTNRLAAKVNYTLSDTRGTGSNPNIAQGAIEQNIGRPINIIAPLLHNETHAGSVILDYRFEKGDGGPILEGLGVNALLTFNSGHNYTRIQPIRELGQSDPWTVAVEPLNDPRASFPIEAVNASTTPWVFNVDLNVSKVFYLANMNLELYCNILNLFNTKHILNVYPTTGTAEDDGWLGSPLAAAFASDPQYVAFYKAINLQNRWAYMGTTRSQQGNDIYGTPRQIRVGVKVEL